MNLASIGLGSRKARAWALYDWANSAYITTIVTAVFPVYFTRVATSLAPETATLRFAIATVIALLMVAVIAPLLGVIADRMALKKPLLALCMGIGALATLAMTSIDPGEWRWALLLFVIGNLGAYGSFIFYDALLPHLAKGRELDRLSTAGYALGYLGGGILLCLNLTWILHPEWFGISGTLMATKLAFASVALWWVGFAIPLLRQVPEPPVAPSDEPFSLKSAWSEVPVMLRELLGYRQAALMLLAFLIYNDGIVTLIRMATVYGSELGLSPTSLIGAIVMVQFVGIPFALMFGKLAGGIGIKRAIVLALAVYCVIALLGYKMTTASHFYLLAFLVATVQGGCQALSRSLFASLIPKSRSTRFFALFAVVEKCAAVIGPLSFAAALAITGSSRVAVLGMTLFFLTGGILLMRVNITQGRQQAAEDST